MTSEEIDAECRRKLRENLTVEQIKQRQHKRFGGIHQRSAGQEPLAVNKESPLNMEEDNHSVDSPAQSNPGTPLPSNPGTPRNDRNDDIALVSSTSCYPPSQGSGSGSSRQQPKPKYSQLLAIIEELGKDIRPTYAGSRSSAERLKRGIVHARILVRECLMETERNARS